MVTIIPGSKYQCVLKIRHSIRREKIKSIVARAPLGGDTVDCGD
jgi:hypothetical protein